MSERYTTEEEEEKEYEKQAVFVEPTHSDQFLDPDLQFHWEDMDDPENGFELIPYNEQGDDAMATNLAVVARRCLRRHPTVQQLLDKFWHVYKKDSTGHINYEEYVNVHKKMSKATTPAKHWTEAYAERLALNDWHRDIGDSSLGLDYVHCCNSFFELADLWADSIDPKAYVNFLQKLYSRITKTMSSTEVVHWRDLRLVEALNLEGENNEDPFYEYSSSSSDAESIQSLSDLEDEDSDQEMKATILKEVSEAMRRKAEAQADAEARAKRHELNLNNFEKTSRASRLETIGIDEKIFIHTRPPQKNRPWSATILAKEFMHKEVALTIQTCHGLDDVEHKITNIKKKYLLTSKVPQQLVKRKLAKKQKEEEEKKQSFEVPPPVDIWQSLSSKLPWRQTPEHQLLRQEFFQRMDTNASGQLSYSELYEGVRNVLQCDELFDAEPVIKEAYKHAAAYGNKRKKKNAAKYPFITFKQFRALLWYLREYFEYWIIFNEVDTSHDSRLTFDELNVFLENENTKSKGLIIQDPYKQFKKLDKANKGYILFNQFAHWALDQDIAHDQALMDEPVSTHSKRPHSAGPEQEKYPIYANDFHNKLPDLTKTIWKTKPYGILVEKARVAERQRLIADREKRQKERERRAEEKSLKQKELKEAEAKKRAEKEARLLKKIWKNPKNPKQF